MKPGSVATDAGSVKGAICADIGESPSPGVTFVGSHPLAGSEKQGFEHADADLFAGRTCVLTPTGREDAEAVEAVEEFWRALGCRVVRMPAGEHDRVLARTSHLPHVAAAAVAAGLRDGEERFAAGGFRDVTRIAGGDPELWAGILVANREAVCEELSAFGERCRAFAAAVSAGDVGELRRLLSDAKVRREAFGEVFK
jgi:prephenate dehydrogenase